ncbi:MAG TPA: NAD(P)/FAD-dependent oxidoreductase [Solirubrobacteraceae bacterium]|jgi:phytoene dehydrogenase-like protein|nr:NAD(P)/FAD-dependent oxidoreductase [Solirubrobacteraceae bacterium]
MSSQQNGHRPDGAEVIIVGAGHNGLTAACYLARAGLDVLVIERSPSIGGMTSTNELMPDTAPGFRFNEGAIHATGIWRASGIAEDLGLASFGLRPLPVDPVHVQLGPDGDSIGVFSDVSQTIEDIRRVSPHDARAWAEMSEMLDVIMDIVLPYMRSQPTRPLSMELLRGVARAVGRPRLLEPMIRLGVAPHAEYLDETFEHPLTKGVLSAMAAFLRMTLDATAWPMIYLGLIQKTKWSAMFVGGTGAVPDALGRCFESHGGRIRCDAPVEEFIMRGNRVAGVRLVGGEELFASEAVLTTCNPKVTLTRLLPDGYLDRRMAKRAEGIPTALAKAASLKINMALSGRTSLQRHEQWRGDGLDLRHPLLDWHTLEQHVAGWEAVTRDEWPNPVPIGCVTVPTATDPTQAPEGCDTIWLWSGVIPVFPREPWAEVKQRVGQGVVDDCGDYFDGLKELEVDRLVLGAPELEARFNSPHGNVYHVDPLLFRFGPLRPAMGFGAYRTPVPGLYLSGAGTHPTGGLCGLPGKLAAAAVLRDGRSGGRSPLGRGIRGAVRSGRSGASASASASAPAAEEGSPAPEPASVG